MDDAEETCKLKAKADCESHWEWNCAKDFASIIRGRNLQQYVSHRNDLQQTMEKKKKKITKS